MIIHIFCWFLHCGFILILWLIRCRCPGFSQKGFVSKKGLGSKDGSRFDDLIHEHD